MEIHEVSSSGSRDRTPAVPLEIAADVAARADDLLRNFAEDASLETALVVDRSGGLVSGISSEPEVTIEVISALVAGASGAMRALVTQLGETGHIESFHQGGDRMVYFRELENRFILVGVSSSPVAPGIVREKARQILAELAEVLRDVRVSPSPAPSRESEETPKRQSLRAVAMKRTAERLRLSAEVERPEPLVLPPPVPDSQPAPERSEAVDDVEELPPPLVAEAMPSEPLSEPLSELGSPATTIEEEVTPREIIEPLEPDDLEIVIEESTLRPSDIVDSPFEVEEEETEERDIEETETVPGTDVEMIGEAETVFQIEEEAPELLFESAPGEAPPLFELDEPEDEPQFEEEDSEDPHSEELVFELDEEGEPEEEDLETSAAEKEGDEEEQGEEAEVRSSGPFYF